MNKLEQKFAFNILLKFAYIKTQRVNFTGDPNIKSTADVEIVAKVDMFHLRVWIYLYHSRCRLFIRL